MVFVNAGGEEDKKKKKPQLGVPRPTDQAELAQRERNRKRLRDLGASKFDIAQVNSGAAEENIRQRELEAIQVQAQALIEARNREQAPTEEDRRNLVRQGIRPGQALASQANTSQSALPTEGAGSPLIGSQEGLGVLGAGLATATTGAGVGAAAGLLGGPAAPVTIPIGAAVGAVAGFITGSIAAISFEKRQNVKESKSNFRGAVGNMNVAIQLAKAGRIEEADKLWNESVQIILASQRNLQWETHNDIRKKLSDGGDELNTVSRFVDGIPARQLLFNQVLLQQQGELTITDPFPQEAQ